METSRNIIQAEVLYATFNQPGVSSAYYGTDYDNIGFGIDTNLTTPTANENRPVNMAVRYLIKAAK